MPRSLPTVRAGGWYHVTNRGVEAVKLFATAETKNGFIEALGEIAFGFAVEFHAYCVMESHYHLLVRGQDEELQRAVSRLETVCSLETQGARFRRMTVGRHLVGVTRYIHRNPVEAGLVRSPGDWRWSSYRGYLDPGHGPRWLRSNTVLGLLGSIGARQRYRTFVE